MDIPDELLCKAKSGLLDTNTLREGATNNQGDEIVYIDKPISYEDFFNEHLLPNRPCVLGRWATEEWPSRSDWVTADNQPNVDFLRQRFGDTTVPVANCNQEEYNSHCKNDMKLSDYLQYLHRKNDPAQNEDRCLYLKDWHFNKVHPEYTAYETPVFFRSDWLNEYWDGRSDKPDDYRFVYFGPKGSWTPFHADVLRSYSWSANICGKKLWWLYRPGQEDHLKDRFGQLAYDLRSDELQDTKKFPNAAKCGRRLEVTQNAGEIIFVPSGWHHQVFNLDDTISINHNWLNACCIDLSWKYVKSCLSEVQQEIDDCRAMDEWHQQCQLILKANSGIDYTEFYRFIKLIATHRLQALDHTGPAGDKISSNNSPTQTTDGSTQTDRQKSADIKTIATSRSHNIFDLLQITSLLADMKGTKEYHEIDPYSVSEMDRLIQGINSSL